MLKVQVNYKITEEDIMHSMFLTDVYPLPQVEQVRLSLLILDNAKIHHAKRC